jgi:uncharacterized protein YyaL (SSP411 family)
MPHRNRLANETSPYLLQHQHNPVDWYPWGEEAFAKAGQEQKPILLSVGYSACHWCHVMAHESFENEAIAELMNLYFVNVKVDREERPDVDAIYMHAVQAMTGAGGWPMTVVMTPGGEPFFGGTYFPAEDRFGQPGFKRVLLSLAHAWRDRRDDLMASASGLTQHLSDAMRMQIEQGAIDSQVLEAALEHLTKVFDEQNGGFGRAPKFPPHSTLKLLLRQDDESVRQMAYLTLDKMARGGIFDQLGGGFARYSVDEIWLVPHFEKMLYDNAQLVQRYAEAYRQTGDALYEWVVEATISWLTREMTSPEGGFYSALDADSEGGEGTYYLWDEQELDALLGADSSLAKAAFAVTTTGNFEGRNILVRVHEQPIATRFGLDLQDFQAKLDGTEKTLLEARETRIRPGLDDKILTSWNGLMLAALADAGRLLKRQDYLELAVTNARFLRDNLLQNGRLWHTFTRGRPKVSGLLEDYAYLGLGLLALYRATFERDWLLLSLELGDAILKHFSDEVDGGFYSTPDDGEDLIVRPKDAFDAAVPAAAGAAAELLIAQARFRGDPQLEALAVTALQSMVGVMGAQPTGFGTLLCAVEFHLSPWREVAVLGDSEGEDTRALLEVLERHASPYVVIALATGPNDPLNETVPWLQGRDLLDGKATAYVCEAGACRLPVTTPEGLARELMS